MNFNEVRAFLSLPLRDPVQTPAAIMPLTGTGLTIDKKKIRPSMAAAVDQVGSPREEGRVSSLNSADGTIACCGSATPSIRYCIEAHRSARIQLSFIYRPQTKLGVQGSLFGTAPHPMCWKGQDAR